MHHVRIVMKLQSTHTNNGHGVSAVRKDRVCYFAGIQGVSFSVRLRGHGFRPVFRFRDNDYRPEEMTRADGARMIRAARRAYKNLGATY